MTVFHDGLRGTIHLDHETLDILPLSQQIHRRLGFHLPALTHLVKHHLKPHHATRVVQHERKNAISKYHGYQFQRGNRWGPGGDRRPPPSPPPDRERPLPSRGRPPLAPLPARGRPPPDFGRPPLPRHSDRPPPLRPRYLEEPPARRGPLPRPSGRQRPVEPKYVMIKAFLDMDMNGPLQADNLPVRCFVTRKFSIKMLLLLYRLL